MLGEFATSKAGHDKDRLYMIVGEEEEWVYLCAVSYTHLDVYKRQDQEVRLR